MDFHAVGARIAALWLVFLDIRFYRQLCRISLKIQAGNLSNSGDSIGHHRSISEISVYKRRLGGRVICGLGI